MGRRPSWAGHRAAHRRRGSRPGGRGPAGHRDGSRGDGGHDRDDSPRPRAGRPGRRRRQGGGARARLSLRHARRGSGDLRDGRVRRCYRARRRGRARPRARSRRVSAHRESSRHGPGRCRMTPSGSPAVMLVAGEASGDLHGAALCRALRELDPRCRLFGMGGGRMAAEGMDVLVDVTAKAVTGGSEAFGQIPRLYRAYRELRAVLEGPDRPSVLVLIDFPEFNLRLARAARRARVPVVYFIPPQVWAWRPWRVNMIRQVVSLVLAVFPFEAPLYRRAGVPVEFVGHPLLDQLQAAPVREVARRRLGIADRTAVVARAAPGTRFVLGLAPTIDRALVTQHLAGGPPVEIVENQTHAVIRAAD